MKLVYINELGPNYKGDNIYEFIFSDVDDVWGDEWDAQPANGNPSPPHIQYIKKVGVLRNVNIDLHLIQDSDFFGVYDSIDGVISLAWENEDSDSIINDKFKSIERIQNIEFNRDWNIETSSGNQKLISSALEFSNKKNNAINYLFENLAFSDSFTGNKHHLLGKIIDRLQQTISSIFAQHALMKII